MIYSHLQVFRTKRGKFTVAIVGQPSYHIMDWNGCNFRRMALPKDMRREFLEEADAFAYEKTLRAAESRLKQYARDNGEGAYFSDAQCVYPPSKFLRTTK